MEPKCPKCSENEPMFSKKRQVYICDSCGHEYKLEKPFMPQRIFISYGHDKHAPLAMRIRDDLRRRGHEAWFDEERLLPGADWESRIEEGLNWAAEGKPQAAFILLLTPHSVRRPDGFCLNEVAQALTLKLRIIPLMVVDSEPPLSICRIQWLDMRDCIPINEKEPLYQPRFQRLLTALENNELDYQGMQSRLLNLLKPIEFSADLLKLLRDFTGRQWVFKEIDSWFNNPAGAKMFWLTGAPGVGKSAIAAWVRENRREIAAFHFCDINSEEKRNPARLVCSIAYQLSTQLPEYQQRLGRLDLENIIKEYHEAYTLFDMLLVQPLTDNFPKPDRTIVVLIDALDEATNRRRNEIVRFLSRSADKTPSWLRFLVTSRPEPEITASFQALSPYVLDTGKDENLTDLRRYIRTKIPEITSAETEAIISRSEGVFLYVQHVVESILTKALDLKNIDQFPRGLGDVYHQFFERQFGEDLGYYESKIVPLLQPVLAAFEPLTKDQLKYLCSITEDTELERRLNRLGSLFPIGGQGECETIRPFHRSLSDWITDRISAGHFVIAKADGNRVLTDHCWNEYQKGVDTVSLYSLRFLPAHLITAQRWDDLIGNDTTPGPLTDLNFIQAKCEAGLVHELISDYNLALNELPEFKEEQEYLRQRDKAVLTYNRALKDYAFKRFNHLQLLNRRVSSSEPTYPEPPKILKDLERPSIPEISSIRAARLRYFSNFVSQHISSLAKLPGETLPLAYNNAREGPVSIQAEKLMEKLKRPWLKRSLRPTASALRPQCQRLLEGHSSMVKCVNVTPDGYNILSGGDDREIRVWDIETGECLNIMVGHYGRIRCLALDNNGHMAISGSKDRTLRIWNIETGDCQCVLTGHNGWINSVNILPDNEHLISASDDKTLRIWNIANETCLKVLEGHKERVNSVSVASNGIHAISASDDQTLRLWNLESGICNLVLKDSGNIINCVSITPDSLLAVSGGNDRLLKIWDLESGRYLHSIEGHNGRIRSVCITPDGRYVISGSNDKTIQIRDLLTRNRYAMKGHSARVRGVCATPNGRYIISGSADTTVRMWNLEAAANSTNQAGHDKWVTNISIAPPDKDLAVSSSDDKTIKAWNIKTGICMRTIKHKSRILDVSLLANGVHAISGNGDCTLSLWDITSGACLLTMKGHNGWVNSVSVAQNSYYVVSGSGDNTVRVWDLETGKCLRVLAGHNNSVKSVSISPDNRYVASGSSDRTIRVWNLKTNKCLHILTGHTLGIRKVIITPDGRHIISTSNDKTMRLWDLKTGQCLSVFDNQSELIKSISVTPDSYYLASGSWGNILEVIEIESRKCISSCSVESPVVSITCKPSGYKMVCGDRNGAIYFFALVNFPISGPPIITALDTSNANCFYCSKSFTPPQEIVNNIENQINIENENQALLMSCPHCKRALKINPFFVQKINFTDINKQNNL